MPIAVSPLEPDSMLEDTVPQYMDDPAKTTGGGQALCLAATTASATTANDCDHHDSAEVETRTATPSPPASPLARGQKHSASRHGEEGGSYDGATNAEHPEASGVLGLESGATEGKVRYAFVGRCRQFQMCTGFMIFEHIRWCNLPFRINRLACFREGER